MKYLTLGVLMLSFLMSGCNATEPEMKQELLVSKENVGKEVVIEGKSANRKGGAVVMNSTVEVWIEDLESWPDEYQDKQLKVTGMLGEDNQLPVFEVEQGAEIVQGIPIEKGMDIVKASHRFILKKAKWELIK